MEAVRESALRREVSKAFYIVSRSLGCDVSDLSFDDLSGDGILMLTRLTCIGSVFFGRQAFVLGVVTDRSLRRWSSDSDLLILDMSKYSSSTGKKKDYIYPSFSLSPADHSKLDLFTPKFSPLDKDYEYSIVRMQKPGVETATRAQMVDYYAQILESFILRLFLSSKMLK
ncbi:hypothetical protein KSP39_PZI007539 [Platanthera zijinensis]|uniref:Uncharacterized protein n=1 Tax=Platanthera zijinensis TaxID=2320716 RepID=A0AAP0BMX5_9ASPA